MNERNPVHPVNPVYKQALKGIALSLPLLFLLLFFFYPLGAILLRSFDRPPVLPEPLSLLRVFGFTLGQATLSTLLTLLLGLPGAYVFSRYRFRGKTLLHALTTIPFVLPTLVVATAFLALIGPNGVLNAALTRWLGLPPLDLQHTLAIILIAHVFYNYSVVLRVVGGVWANLNPHLEEAARMLGAGRLRAWFEVTLPQLAPAVGAASLLVFMFCLTSFGTVMILGGPRFATVEVEIYRQAAHLLNLPVAAALSLGQMALTLAVMRAYTALQRRATRPLDVRSRQTAQKVPRQPVDRLAILGNVALMAVLLFAPLLALLWRSLTLGGPLSLRHFAALFQDSEQSYFWVSPGRAIGNSLLFASATALLSTVLGALGAYLLAGRDHLRKISVWLDPLLVLPLGTSAVTLGLGYLLAFNRPPLNLIGSPAMIPVVHALIAFPFVLRSVLPALRGIQPALREAASTLGATPWRIWLQVDLPLLARPLLVGAAYAFSISLGEFGATLLLARREYATMPVAIYRYLSNPGTANLGQALAMSVLLMLVCTASFVLIERFRVGEAGEF
ncbi:MAG: iron ABC transporter permease [Anaerolineae bacterium]|nr:iron ABC transporter permease [Anaerolineae bacterium]